MSTSTVANLANALSAAETGLVAQLQAGTARLERVGESLPAELAKLQEAAALAKARLAETVATFRQTVADVAAFAEQLSAELFAELVPDVMGEPVAPAPAPEPAGVTSGEGDPVTAAPTLALPADPFPATGEGAALPAPALVTSKARKLASHEGARARLNGRAKSKAGH